MVPHSTTIRKQTLNNLFHAHGEDFSFHFPDTPPPDASSLSYTSTSPTSTTLSTSPLAKSPWSARVAPESYSFTGLMGSLIREEGHIYSLAAFGDLLYTGSQSKNIRVWKNQKEFSSFKSSSGLVKTIIISGDQIFSGHQDGKIRIWKVSRKHPSHHKRVGSMPTKKARVKNSLSLINYWNSKSLQHTDAISCLSFSEDRSLLYSTSWDRTFNVWRIADSKCLESVRAHDDAVNAIITGFDGLVFTGSADGSVKVWRREFRGKGTKHYLSQTLLRQECAVTSLAVDPSASFLYSGSSDGLVNFWERQKVLCHSGVLKGHNLAVLCLATAGNLAFSGSADANICVWQREGGKHICLSVLIGHTGPVKCLAVEEKANDRYWHGGDRWYTVYSGGIDKSVKIWRVTTQAARVEPGMVTATTRLPRRQQGDSIEVLRYVGIGKKLD